ncbi:hypothetical protein N7523_001108 [Penicillium sp. IBT 18751x]|nr:hypothetical protein N7523_001108 [Penicillium sp. IBT 18751x]
MLKPPSIPDISRLPHVTLITQMMEAPLAEVQREELATAVSPYPTTNSVAQETHSDAGDGDQLSATKRPPNYESMNWWLDGIKDILSASMGDSNHEMGETSLKSSKSHDLSGLLPIEPDHSESKTLTQHFKDQEAEKSMSFRNELTKLSSLHPWLPDGAVKDGIPETIDRVDPIFSPTLISPNTETGTQTMSSSSTTRTSSRESYNGTIDNSNILKNLFHQGVESILSSVIGGSLAFIGIVLLHRLVLRSFYKGERGSMIDRGSLPMDDSFDEKLAVGCAEVAEISHFSMSPSV